MSHRVPELYAIPIIEIARICRVSLKTAARWKAGQTVPPHTARMILTADLGCFDPKWAGWSVARGNLYSPEGWELPLGEVRALPLLRSQLSAYQDVNRSLKAALEEARTPQMEDQPLPDQWQVSYGS